MLLLEFIIEIPVEREKVSSVVDEYFLCRERSLLHYFCQKSSAAYRVPFEYFSRPSQLLINYSLFRRVCGVPERRRNAR